MAFDIHKMDRLDVDDADTGRKLQAYQEALLEDFARSPEGQAYFAAHPDAGGGYWIGSLSEIGFGYLGTALPQMTVDDVEEIVTELFPSKISLFSPDEADEAVPELLALWEYLKREHRLPQADSILTFLREVEPEFKGMMFDPSKFGMAKSFVMAGQTAGFDMTDEDQVNTFMTAYNAGLALSLPGGLPPRPPVSAGRHKVDRAMKKKRRQAKAARKRSRPRKK